MTDKELEHAMIECLTQVAKEITAPSSISGQEGVLAFGIVVVKSPREISTFIRAHKDGEMTLMGGLSLLLSEMHQKFRTQSTPYQPPQTVDQ